MKIENAVPYLGALVTELDVKRMTDDEWKTLYQTWLDRHVLIVRGQDLSKADFLAYSRRFGRLKPHLVKHTRDPANPEITLMGVTSMAKDTTGREPHSRSRAGLAHRQSVGHRDLQGHAALWHRDSKLRRRYAVCLHACGL